MGSDKHPLRQPRFVIGIDLGTTHCVLAASPVAAPHAQVVSIPQLTGPGEVAPRPLLPSFIYLPAPGEIAPNQLALPWGPATQIVGEWARALGAQVPNRLVASAKSWICHGGVNRRAPILPWSAPDAEPHISALEATVHYLTHLRCAWDAAEPQAPMAQQELVLTVPASFDEGARELTQLAAQQAGLGQARLLEEPQAAFYDFLASQIEHGPGGSGDLLAQAKLILVVDVGGGTTDLSLLRVLQRAPGAATGSGPAAGGRLRLERVAVGGHLMLGGDNMDAAVARHVLAKAGIEQPLEPAQWSALVRAACHAKERLLGPEAPREVTVVLPGRGARLIASTRSVQLARDEVQPLLLDGFLPFVEPQAEASRAGRAGLTTLGLPYVTEPAIVRHIATFLRRHAAAAIAAGAPVEHGLARPDAVLLNGGVFKAPLLAERLAQVVGRWFGLEAMALLPPSCLETAVACGAVRYGLARRGHGTVISGGSARAYYVGVEDPQGRPKALCVAPRGMLDGQVVEVRDHIFQLMLNEGTAFPLLAYTGDRCDSAGVLRDYDDELEALPPLETVLRAPKGVELCTAAQGGVPVRLSAALSLKGDLELHLSTVELPPQRWRVEFTLGAPNQTAAAAEPSATSKAAAAAAPADSKLAAALALVEQAWPRQHAPQLASASQEAVVRVKALRGALEQELGPRGAWSLATCRALAQKCLERAPGRALSADHELNWLRLLGWCARPGVGGAGDTQLVRQLWALQPEGLAFAAKPNWAQWWVLWRRVAAGLGRAEQEALLAQAQPALAPNAGSGRAARPQGLVEMLQLLAVLERLSREQKKQIGVWFMAQVSPCGPWWPLGRLGAREPFYGEVRDVVEAAVAEAWLAKLLELDWQTASGAGLAAVLLARLTADKSRDVPAALRERVRHHLQASAAPKAWVQWLLQPPDATSTQTLLRLCDEAVPAA